MVLVTVRLFIFWTPRITMHMCLQTQTQVSDLEPQHFTCFKEACNAIGKGNATDCSTSSSIYQLLHVEIEEVGLRRLKQTDVLFVCFFLVLTKQISILQCYMSFSMLSLTYAASITTATPFGCRASQIAMAICLVRRS